MDDAKDTAVNADAIMLFVTERRVAEMRPPDEPNLSTTLQAAAAKEAVELLLERDPRLRALSEKAAAYGRERAIEKTLHDVGAEDDAARARRRREAAWADIHDEDDFPQRRASVPLDRLEALAELLRRSVTDV